MPLGKQIAVLAPLVAFVSDMPLKSEVVHASYLSPEPHAEPHAAGLSPLPHALPHAEPLFEETVLRITPCALCAKLKSDLFMICFKFKIKQLLYLRRKDNTFFSVCQVCT